MLRISLIIAIIATIAASAVNFIWVKEQVTLLAQDRDSQRTQKEQYLAERDDARTKLAKTEEDLKSTQGKLADTEKSLKQTTAKLGQSEKKVAELNQDLEKTRSDRDDAQQKLAQWDVLQVQPEQVKSMISELAKVKRDRDVFAEESKTFAKKAESLQHELDKILGPDKPVELPHNLRGRVVAVDPKFDFVVIDVGGDQGALEEGEMLVNRNGKLVGKIRISSVQPKKSVANIDPQWKKSEIMEGDQVIARIY